MANALSFLVLIWMAGQSSGGGMVVERVCRTFLQPEKRGQLGEPELVELSGLVASREHPGVLYAHNDSGDFARFFALSTTGAALGELRLSGATAKDWEDIALGPCPSGTCLFLGDIGDNLQVRGDYAVYRVAEPTVEVARPLGVVEVAYDRLPFSYPAGARHNAEALLVHPSTGELYVLTKRGPGLPSAVFRFPQPFTPGRSATLIKVADLAVPGPKDLALSGADLHPSGRGLVVRMYNRVAVAVLAPGKPFDEIFTGPFTTVPSAKEGQGEAVAWAGDGRGFFTASEGRDQPLHFTGCVH